MIEGWLYAPVRTFPRFLGYSQPARRLFVPHASSGGATPLASRTKIRRAKVIAIGWDAAEDNYRVRLRILSLQPGESRSTVQTHPPLVRSTRWVGKTVEVVTSDAPPWQVGEEVTLRLDLY